MKIKEIYKKYRLSISKNELEMLNAGFIHTIRLDDNIAIELKKE